VAVLISILQAVTQIQESSLTFVPRLVTAAAVILALGGWMLTVLTQFATRLIGNIPAYL
jgi:flagellar biosynthetic protein FliQ